MPDEVLEQPNPLSKSTGGILESHPQLIQRKTAQISEINVLELVPDILLWIDFRRVGWEILDRHSSDGVHLAKLFEFTAPVDLRSIPQHEHSFWNVRQEVAKEQHRAMRADRRCVNLHVQTALKCQPSNNRQMLVGKGRTQDRRFAGVAPCLGHGWTQKEAGLVNEDDGSGLILGFF
jgi:hypothetical protein